MKRAQTNETVAACLQVQEASFRLVLVVSLAVVVALGTLGSGLVASGEAFAVEGAQAGGQPALADAANAAQATGDGTAFTAANAGQNATPKEEVVYAKLLHTGAVSDVYAVNVLSPAAPGKVTDYGSYTEVQNLTDSSDIQQVGNAVSVEVAGGSLSYQGNMGACALPWDVSIAYELDGKRIDESDLGGKSGKLLLTITTKKNASVNAVFFDNYLLQITVPFVSNNTTNVVTEEGQIALAGSNTQVTFAGMPGKEAVFKVEAQVSNFSMGGMTFAAVPFSMGIEKPNTGELVSGFRQLGDGVGALKGGAEGLASGAGSLASGVDQVASGMWGMADGAANLAGGITTYKSALEEQAAQARANAVGAEALQQQLQAAIGAYTFTYQGVYQALVDNQVSIEDAARQALQNQKVIAAAEAIGAAAQNIGASAGLLGAAGALEGAASGTQPLAAGASSLADGARQAASGAGQLSAGASQLSSGAGQLAQGTGVLHQEVQGIPDKVQQEIDAMMANYDKSNFKPVSFTSPQNTKVSLVQFVMSTNPLEVPSSTPEEQPEEEKSFWDRFLALFGF